MIFLENEHLVARFTSKGAELQGLQNKTTNVNYLWSGDPAYWAKHSPILFPIVGALKKGLYHYQGKTYKLPRHGFARDKTFEVRQLSKNELVFTLRDAADTLEVYPFSFQLNVRYRLLDRSLCCTYEVENPGTSDMLFSIGGHPAFAIPLDYKQEYTDYYLEFNNDETLHYHTVTDDLIGTETKQLNLDNQKLRLKHELFYQDALVIKTMKSDCISIKNNTNAAALHFIFRNFPYFGIWAAKDAPFVCLEPWCGLADAENHNQELADKEGIVTLPAGQIWQRSWQVDIE